MCENISYKLYDRSLTNETFVSVLDALLLCPSAPSIIVQNGSKLLFNENIDIFFYIFNPQYSSIFIQFVKKNIIMLLRSIVSRQDFKSMKLFIENYREETLDNAAYLLIDNPSFERTLFLLHFEYKNKIFIRYRDIILQEMSRFDEKKDYFSDFELFISFLSSLSTDYIDSHFEEIKNIYCGLTEKLVYGTPIYEFDTRRLLLNDMRLLASRNEKLRNLFNSDKKVIITFLTSASIGKLERQKVLRFFEKIIEELESYAECGIEGIEAFSGYSSMVLIIGDMVIKVNEEVEKIPYDPVLLRPLIRTNICYLGSNEPLFGLEIYNRVKTDDLDTEKVYEMFKAALQRGTLLEDIALRNSGILLKPNTPYLQGACKVDKFGNTLPYDVDDKDVNIISANQMREVLPVGEYIHLDLGNVTRMEYDIDKMITELLPRYSSSEIATILFGMLSKLDNDEGRKFLERYIQEIKDTKRTTLS